MTAVVKEPARDLEADLAICEAVTPGPWVVMSDGGSVATEKTDRDGWHSEIIRPRTPRPSLRIMKFIASAREGWPYAIRRAIAAEAEVDRLRNELNHLQEREHSRGCWD